MAVEKLSKQAVARTAKFLLLGGVAVFPTDTVYGFLADATNKKAVERIFKIKKRPKSKPLPIFVKDIKMAKTLALIDEPASAKGFGEAKQEKILRKKWPGKFTFVLKAKKQMEQFHRIVPMVKAKDGTVALRVPKFKFLNDLLKKINKPLAQTSVNISGQEALSKIGDIINQFEKSDILIIDGGNLRKSKPSKIIDLTKSDIKILRK